MILEAALLEESLNETTIKSELAESEKATKVTVQHLYDLRKVIDFASDKELHDLLKEVLGDKESSPSGNVVVGIAKLEKSPVGREAMELLNSPLHKVIAATDMYTGRSGGDFGDDAPLVDLENGTVKAQLLYDIRNLTDFISDAELYDLFGEILGGEPSPSGFVDVSIEKLAATNLGKLALSEINKPTWEALDAIKDYDGE